MFVLEIPSACGMEMISPPVGMPVAEEDKSGLGFPSGELGAVFT